MHEGEKLRVKAKEQSMIYYMLTRFKVPNCLGIVPLR